LSDADAGTSTYRTLLFHDPLAATSTDDADRSFAFTGTPSGDYYPNWPYY